MKQLSRSDFDLFAKRKRSIPTSRDDALSVLRSMVAKWEVPTPTQVQNGGTKTRKARATASEMADRRIATWWLMNDAERALSVRGVAYRAEALLGLPKTELAFDLIEKTTVELRDNGLVDWSLIRDGRRTKSPHGRREDIPHTLNVSLNNHRLDLWADAPVQAQVWIEKEGLVGAIAPRAHDIGLDVWPASGFVGAGFLRDAMQEAADDGRPLVVLQMVDYDSSGNRMRESSEQRLRTFAKDLDVEVQAIDHVALTRVQIDSTSHPVPTRPQKTSNHQREDDDPDAAELDAVDALYPDRLGDWLEEAVEPYWGAIDRQPVLEQEEADLVILGSLVSKWPEVERWLDEQGGDQGGVR